MKAFTLLLQDSTRLSRIDDVVTFVGEDASGSFGILANHARMMTVLVMGLARFKTEEADWQYLALPGAVLHFNDNVLTLNTRHFLQDTDYMRISKALKEELVAEEEHLRGTKTSLRRMEEEILKRMWEMGRKGG
jgi:F-type H+-transporting ATPase subunit epsilon